MESGKFGFPITPWRILSFINYWWNGKVAVANAYRPGLVGLYKIMKPKFSVRRFGVLFNLMFLNIPNLYPKQIRFLSTNAILVCRVPKKRCPLTKNFAQQYYHELPKMVIIVFKLWLFRNIRIMALSDTMFPVFLLLHPGLAHPKNSNI